MRSIVNILFWLVLSLWLAMVVAPGAAAISAFTQLPAQGASIDTYAAYFKGDTEGMGRMVAGFVTDPIFVVTDLVQWILAPLALLLALIAARPLRIISGPGQWISIGAITCALGLVILHNAWMAPRMATNLATYREAAAAGNAKEADMALAAFNQDHKPAEALFGIRLLLLLVAVGASAGATSSTAGREDASR